MSHNHKTLISKVAVTAVLSILGATALPGITSPVSAATVVASTTAKTAPGQPKFGESGPAVVAVQNAIMRHGFTLRGGATGNFDTRTRRVLRTFQRVVGLKVTGVVDAATARVLKIDTAAPSAPAASPAPAAAPAAAAPAAAPVAAPVSSGPFITKLPKRGSGSKNVVIVQKALIAAGVPVAGGADGIFGASTTRAITAFQKARNINATGRLDQQTAIALGVMAPPVAVAVAPATPAAPSAPVAAAAPSASPRVSSLPTRGQRSNDVVIVQTALIAAGIAVKGGADGIFGGATAVAISKFQTQHGFPATGRLDERTALKLGVIAPPAVQLAVFPVQGPCSFSNTWHAPRGDRKHMGVDIIANEGNLIYAVADGTITRVYNEATSKLAGNGVRLTTADGTYFFYGHFQRIADGITVGTQVKAGQVIGYNGKTGNTSTPHLHFEIHPQGGPAIDPTSAVAAVNACHVTAPLPIP
jgi:peptidoglycan hydrolase-like protein with peptidoglycan-binding domain